MHHSASNKDCSTMVCHKLHCCTVTQLTSLNYCYSASKRGCSAILPSSAVHGRQCNCSAPQPVASLPLAAVAAVARHQLANPPLSLWNTSIQKTFTFRHCGGGPNLLALFSPRNLRESNGSGTKKTKDLN